MRTSYEAIYLSLFVQAKGALRKELSAALRTGRAVRAVRYPRARRGAARARAAGGHRADQ